MKVIFADSFYKSLNKISMHGRWWYKLYSLFRYDVIRFVKNVWLFRREMLGYYHIDYIYSLELLRRSLGRLHYSISRGNEIPDTRIQKLRKIEEAVIILNGIIEDNYTERAEDSIGAKVCVSDLFTGVKLTKKQETINRHIFMLSDKLQQEDWERLFTILKGSNSVEPDGTDMRSWWV